MKVSTVKLPDLAHAGARFAHEIRQCFLPCELSAEVLMIL